MSKLSAAAGAPAAPAASLACGNAACGKALVPPLLQCSKCKAEALLQGVPGGRPGRPRRAQRAVRICSLTCARSRHPRACLHPPRQCRDSRWTCADALETALVVNTKKSETGRGSVKGQQ